jgi:hypothetical protein
LRSSENNNSNAGRQAGLPPLWPQQLFRRLGLRKRNRSNVNLPPTLKPSFLLLIIN